MPAARRSLWVLFLAIGALGLAGCEPYMSMTDQIPAQTRRATALLPETPKYVGMVDVHTALRSLDDLRGTNVADSLRQMDNPRLRAFLDATGLDLKTDVQAVYGALEGEDAFSAVLFASLRPAQMDRYLEQAPGDAGRRSSYRDAPLYRLPLGLDDETPADTLTVAFVDDGTMALGSDADRVTAMVDRARAKEPAGLAANDDYMTLVKRVGHGSTAWLAGRDVVETALKDSEDARESKAQASSDSRVSRAGLQHALAQWSDRMLGLSEVSSFGGAAGEKVSRLKSRLREQAVSVTLTDAGLEGQVYLTMRDNASAASVVDVAEGAVAVMKLSQDDLDARQRDLIDEIQIERDGAIVHVQFALDRERLRKGMQEDDPASTVQRVPQRPSDRSFHRIDTGASASPATSSPLLLSTAARDGAGR
jgi:hypothetical protein